MSATAPAQADLSDKQRQILRYLEERVPEQSFFKSRLIGEDLGLSPKEVGANMVAIREGDFEIEVEKWGYSSSTTWQVTI